jgi:multiple sugar transport system ATP-binding protein
MVYVTHDQVEAMAMADQIAVMDQGVLQQFGPPLEIYEHPANTFVAGFVGSTRINFIPAAGVTGIESPRQNGNALVLAIRPEYVRIVAAGAPEATIGARVNLVEPLGAKDVVHVSWNGHDIRAIGTPGERPHVGDNVGLAFDRSRVRFFDETTGEAVG